MGGCVVCSDARAGNGIIYWVDRAEDEARCQTDLTYSRWPADDGDGGDDH